MHLHLCIYANAPAQNKSRFLLASHFSSSELGYQSQSCQRCWVVSMCLLPLKLVLFPVAVAVVISLPDCTHELCPTTSLGLREGIAVTWC